MKLVAELEELLHNAKSHPAEDSLRIKGWRVLVGESKLVSLGIKENSPGSVYTPPSYRQGESGEVYIIWEDGRLSQAHVQSAPVMDTRNYWSQQLGEWRLASYEDPEGADIPDPAPLPIIAVEDRAVQKILSGEDQILFDQLDTLLKSRPANAQMNAGIQAAWGYRHVRNSKGLAATYQESQYAASFSFDSLIGGGFAKRRLPQPAEWESRWNRTLNYYEALKKEAPEINRDTKVIFSPGVVTELLGQFVVPNFIGQSILDGRSAFKVDQFESQEKVFHKGVQLVVDPLRPFELGSYLVTNEGVPAEKTLLVDKGTLKTPVLRMKDAKRWGGKPTGIPYGTAGLYLNSQEETPWEQILETIDDGILILSVLGMHTQNSVSGEYSLSVPLGLRIQNGMITGKRSVKLSGNFLKDLASAETRFGRSELDSKPYLLVRTGVQNM